MKLSVNYEFAFGSAIHPATKKRERIAVVSREYLYKNEINEDWDETLWMFWVKGSLLKYIDGETSEKAILDHLMLLFGSTISPKKTKSPAPILTNTR